MKETQHGDIILVSEERWDKPVGHIQSRQYGPGEITDPDRRRLAVDGLSLLWKAMQLTEGPSLLPNRPDHRTYDMYAAVYRHVGLLLLGDDYPEFEVRT